MARFTVRISRREFRRKHAKRMLKKMLRSGGGVRVVFTASLLLACSLLGACSGPTSPSYVCRTQPRAYSLPDGRVSIEVDTYASSVPCPAIPIQ